jgi:uncharacterized protein YegP (UPF0339 family)
MPGSANVTPCTEFWRQAADPPMQGYRFEIGRDRRGQYRVRFIAPQGETVFMSQPIVGSGPAQSLVIAVQLHGPDAQIVDMTAAPQRYERRPREAISQQG